MTTTEAVPETPAPTPEPQAEVSRRGLFISLRWKLTASFTALFTIVFLFIGFWVVQFSATNAQQRLEQQLVDHVTGGSQTVNADAFAKLIATVPAVPDASKKSGLGYPTSPLFEETATTLFNIRRTVGAGTYTWYKDPVDGKMYTAVSSGYLLSPQFGYTYKVPVDQVADAETYSYMEQGLTQAVQQPAYTDAFGSWISAYAPIYDANGQSVGGIGQDYSLAYVDEVRAQAIRQVIPVLVASFIVLVLLILLLSALIVRPIKRLTTVTSNIADGEYDHDLSSLTNVRLPDELFTLASAVGVMAAKIAKREQSLKQEVRRLTVEIDQARRTEAVKELTESDSFADIATKAAAMRRRMNEDSST